MQKEKGQEHMGCVKSKLILWEANQWQHQKTIHMVHAESQKISQTTSWLVDLNFPLKRLAAATFLCLLFLIPGPIAAQVANNTITGRITDSTGAIVPGASVTVTSNATQLVLQGKTNSVGTYVFPQLVAGQYSVAAQATGFKKTETKVTLTVSQTAEVDLTLQVGSPTQSVTVTAGEAGTKMDTQDSTLAYSVTPQVVSQLPLNGRNPFALAALSPGIAPGGGFFGEGISTTSGAVVAAAANDFETNGGIGGSNQVYLDGISMVVCCQGQPALAPSVEVLDQFKVITGTPPAQYGRSSGGFINIVTKTGGNKLHGDVYDFLRNDALDAANFFTKRSGTYPFPGRNSYTLPHRFNQFGLFVSGPVVIPGVYNGKGKTFFTFGYEGIRNGAPTYHTTTVPTLLMRQGIFTEAPYLIYDPNNVAPDPAHPGQYLRQPIAAASNGSTSYPAGRYIPNINPVAQKTIPLLPVPNAPGVANNYNYATDVFDHANQFNFRVDHDFSANQRSFIRGTRDTNQRYTYGLFNVPTDPTGSIQTLTGDLLALGHVWAASPSLVLTFNYGFARQTNFLKANSFFNLNATNYGYSSLLASQQMVPGLPFLTITGIASPVSTGVNFNRWSHYTHSLNGTAMWQRGHHILTFGYNGQLVMEMALGLGNPDGGFSFTPLFTSGPNPNAAVPAAQSAFDSWASFLLGYPSSGSLTRQTQPAFNLFYHALFLEDDWRIHPKLTLNLGLRWNIETGFEERHNHWADYDPSITNPLSAYTGIPFTGGLEYLGVSGNPGRTWATDYKEFSPRIGFAYAPTQRTVVRGGYAILYLPTSERGYNGGTTGFTQPTSYVATIDGRIPSNTIDNPFPSGVLQPLGAAGGVQASAGSTATGFLYNDPVSHQQQWNLGIQQSLPKDVLLNVGYVGGAGANLPITWRPNDLNPKYFGNAGDQTQVAYLQALVSNPFYGSSAAGTLAAPTVQRAQLLAAFPQYASNTGMANTSLQYPYDDVGSTTYHALQALLAVNHPNGLSGTLAYTWSKLLGNVTDVTNGFLNATGNPSTQDFYLYNQTEWSNLATDVPQRVAGNLIYRLPFGKGQQFGSGMTGWKNEIAGGWTVASIITVQSGFPLGLTQTGGQPFSGSRPTYVAGVDPLTSGPTNQRLGGGGAQAYFNPAAFRLSQSFELGNVPRSAAALRSPLTFQDDLSLIKDFPISDVIRIQFRAEAFNVLNTVQFGFPNTTYGSSTFGVISSQANLPRNVQFALKIFF